MGMKKNNLPILLLIIPFYLLGCTGTDGTNGACNHPQMGKLMRSLATDICFVLFFGSVSVPNANKIISLIIHPSLLFLFYFFPSFTVLLGYVLIIAIIGMISFLHIVRVY